MHICFIVEGYPYKGDPFMTFVRSLIAEISRKGHKCTVIVPQSISRAIAHNLPIRPRHWVDDFGDGFAADIYQPYTISFSKFGKNFAEKIYTKKVNHVFSKMDSRVDALYAHFWRMGIRASQIKTDVPLFVASGESIIGNDVSNELKEKMRERLRGAIYVSKDCYNESIEKGYQKDNSNIIIPNGYNPNEFKPMNRSECRDKLGWDQKDFIVSFLGTFSERKGMDRLSEAIIKANKEEAVSVCFIGRGTVKPKCTNIVFCGAVDHDNVATYLCASDVFVLPTLHEGCSNAIVEALACGIPVISSDLAFNDEILDDSCSIRVDPLKIEQITDALLRLKRDSSLRKELSLGALKKAKSFQIGTRADKILDFINNLI